MAMLVATLIHYARLVLVAVTTSGTAEEASPAYKITDGRTWKITTAMVASEPLRSSRIGPAR
jgi:hypothetical protein